MWPERAGHLLPTGPSRSHRCRWTRRIGRAATLTGAVATAPLLLSAPSASALASQTPRSASPCSVVTRVGPPPAHRNRPSVSYSPRSGASYTDVVVTVPPLVGVILDGRGRPVLVRTNTAAAPSCGDLFWIYATTSAGVGHPATLRQVDAVLSSDLGGPWRVGVWRTIA